MAVVFEFENVHTLFLVVVAVFGFLFMVGSIIHDDALHAALGLLLMFVYGLGIMQRY